MTRIERQYKVAKFVQEAFSPCMKSPGDPFIRSVMVLEESLELCQAIGLNIEEAISVVRRVYERPTGRVEQEAAQVGICLLAFAAGQGLDLDTLEDYELERINSKPREYFTKRMFRKIIDLPTLFHPDEVREAHRHA